MNMSKKLKFQGSTKEDGFKNRKETFIVNESVTSNLKTVSENNHITLSALIQTAWGVVLQKYNNVNDVVFGAVISGRQCKVEGIERMVGLCINAIPLRVKGENDTNFITLAKQINNDVIKANTSYGYSSLADIQALTKMKGKLINHILVYENYPMDESLKSFNNKSHAELQVTDMEVFEQTNYDFGIVIIPGEKIKIEITYNNYVYNEEIIDFMGRNLCHTLLQVANDPVCKLGEISVVNEEEKNKVLNEFNKQTPHYPVNKSIQELFQERVEKAPNDVALVFENKELTYKELNEKANKLARLLIEKGIGKNSIIALMVEPSDYLIIGILGILKTGSAFLPIDNEIPKSRIEHILKDSQASMILSNSNLFEDGETYIEYLDVTDESLYAKQGSKNLETHYDLESEVYVIYTSGTSGVPKGVSIKHKSLINYVLWACEQLKLDSVSRSLVTSKYSFDLCYTSIFPILMCGGQIHIINKGIYLDPISLIKYIEMKKISYLKITPTLFSTLMDYSHLLKSCVDLNIIILGGENINISNVKKIAEECPWIAFINHYGPTECTIGCIAHYIDLAQIQHCESYNKIGKPINNTKIYIVNSLNDIVPIGVVGEICVSGMGLAKGYYNNHNLTNEKFIDNPFDKGTKMYKTGDLGRWLPDGHIEYLGRIDNQVKIRGFRVETGEIENHLLKLDGIKEAIVVDKIDENESTYLCAYVTTEKEVIVNTLKKELVQLLPGYMIPSFIIKIDELPITPNGKIDRKALPDPDLSYVTESQYEGPRNDVEEKLVTIWEKLLGRERIGINNDFFDLGGHSLKAAFTISHIRKELGVEVRIKELLENSTIKQLSELIQKKDKKHY
ncbi:amino acid adenylation domain-containing protein, partial [Bacillus cereus]|nr:amino acid adenylation domain-containing protein [Bacillus cereus]MCU4858432.1 amino acid adenylation domain-containing protein [Bacillus cereus]MCU4875187.1 amino acid adenylation domain-containing protein [Bacillus cereus]MCU4943443.1 amino acid adenylation domain-containing protein [Bacillus cereus]